MVKPRNIQDRIFTNQAQKTNLKIKLKQLTEASNLPEWAGEFFLNEIKLSTDKANEHLRERARMLGLLEWGNDVRK